jgi:hypothetical protein
MLWVMGLLGNCAANAEYEARRFDILGGARYTPDWVDPENKVAVEAKAEFIRSRDSRRRFDEARYLHTDWTWVWARSRAKGRKGKRIEIEVYPANAGAAR